MHASYFLGHKDLVSVCLELEYIPFLSLTIHLPPNLLASSSHMGLMPILKRWKSEWLARSPGFTRWLYRLQNCSQLPNLKNSSKHGTPPGDTSAGSLMCELSKRKVFSYVSIFNWRDIPKLWIVGFHILRFRLAVEDTKSIVYRTMFCLHVTAMGTPRGI